MTMLSRVLGLTRDIVIARFFSAGDAADAFFVAFKLPNFLRRLFAEGSFSLAFVPVLTEYKNQRSLLNTRDLIDHVAGTLATILFVITLIGTLAAPLLVYVFAAGFIDQPGKFELTANMLRITFPYIFLISMTALAAGILNSWKQFAVPAFTPVLLNLSMIGCIIWLTPQLDVPVYALAWGVLLAGIIQLLFQLPFLYQLGLLPKPKWGWQHKGVQKIIKLMIPALFGSSVTQINLLFDTFIASFLISGSVSWLYYSDRLLEFPLGVFGIALATVVLPNLSEAHFKQGKNHFHNTMSWAIKIALLIAIPATTGLLLLTLPILASLFQYGEFTQNDTLMASYSLMAYSIGLPAFILIKILANGFYARQDSKTPVSIGIKSMLLNMLLNVVFVVTFVVTDWTAAHVGLALATSGSAWFNALKLAHQLKQQGIIPDFSSQWISLFRVIGATIGMGILIWLMLPSVEFWTSGNWLERILQLTKIILPSILFYLVLLWIMGARRQHYLL